MSAPGFFDRLKKLDHLHRVALRLPFLTATLRAGSYAAYRALELALQRAHPHQRVVAQARVLQAAASQKERPASKKVLFFTVRGWYIHASTEAVLAKALEMRGAETSFFLCGGTLEQCDFKPGTDPFVTRPLCWRCTGFARRLFEAFDLPVSFLEAYVDSDLRAAAEGAVARMGRDELESFRYRDLPLFDWVQASVQRSLLRGDIGEDPFSERVLRGFLKSAVLYVEACEKLLDGEDPQVVVMTNGLFFAERIMLEAARRRGVAAVTYERGMPLNSVLFDHNQPAIRFDLDPHWPAARQRALTEDESRELDTYLTARARGSVGVVDVWPSMERDRETLYRKLRLSRDRPVVALFTNVLWDSAVFGRDLGFAGMFDWLRSTLELLSALPEVQLVIRVHPAEVRIPMSESRDRAIDRISEEFPELPPNVRLVGPEDPASSYTLVGFADAILVYTSTIGLEAAVRGKRVLVAGRTHYRARGFTLDVEAKEGYRELLLASFAGAALSTEEVDLARRYAHLFFFRFMHDFPWVVDTPRSARRLTFSDFAELRPGRHPVLDRICDAILHGRPFVALDPEEPLPAVPLSEPR
ncbi:MAG: hypothetical protein V3T81_05715 [Thermoanaerobaculia bacterium]